MLQTNDSELEERAASKTTAATLDRLGEVEHAELLQVQGALRRLNDGTYGKCGECGHSIEPRRLHVLPEAVICASCSAARLA